MKVVIKKTKNVEAKILSVNAGVRYWEDATVNGVEDIDGTLIPCKNSNSWCPEIDIDNGKIINWEIGKVAQIHYKVCDSGSYYIKDEDGNVILKIEDNYVPDIMCPEGSGYGDYIIMNVNSDGSIQKWVADIGDDFDEEQD